MKYSFILLFFALLFSCKKKEGFDQVLVFGHAGNGLNFEGSVYIENSKEAIDLALSISGVSGTEVDIQVALDNEIWLFHDDLLETNTTGKGCVGQKSSTELSELHYTTAQKEKILPLSELDVNQFAGKTILLDIRHFNSCNEQLVLRESIETGLETVITNNPNTQFIVLTSHLEFATYFKSKGYVVFYNVADYATLVNQDLFNTNVDGFIIKNKSIEQNEVNLIQNQGKKVIIFEMRSPKYIRKALEKHPYAVITDDIRSTIIEQY